MKKFILRVLFAGVIFLFGMVSVQATWYYTSPGPTSFPSQQGPCYCSVGAAQGWIKTLTGTTYSQNEIAYMIDSGLSNCTSGANAGEVANGLNAYAGSWAGYRRQFAYYEVNPSSRDAVIVNMIKNLHRQVMLAASTVKADGSIRSGGHWMLVWAADIDASGIVHGIRVHDPLAGSAWQANYQVVGSGDILQRFETFPKRGHFDRWAPLANGMLQYVTYYTY